MSDGGGVMTMWGLSYDNEVKWIKIVIKTNPDGTIIATYIINNFGIDFK